MEIIAYFRGSELSSLIRRFSGPDVRFIVPSQKDKSWWLERSGRGQYGPLDSPPSGLWTWQNLYDDISSFALRGKNPTAHRRYPLSPPDHLLILRRLLDDVLTKELLALWPGLARSGFLDDLSNDLRELMNEAVRPEQMEAPELGGLMPRLLPEVYRRYLAYLEGNGLLDSAQIWTVAAELLDGAANGWGRELTLVFTGFLSFTHGQIELLRVMETRCARVVVLKPEAGMADFYDVSRQFSLQGRPAAPSAGGRILGLTAAEPGLEPEAVARGLALWSLAEGELAREMPFPGFHRIGIMAPRGDRAMMNALERYGVPFTLETGETVARTLPGEVLASLRMLRAQDFPPYGTALLLSQPCFAGASFPVADALKAGPSGLDAWEAYLEPRGGEALRAVQSIRAFCRSLRHGGTPAELMKAFHQFLTTPGLWLDRMGGPAELDEEVRTMASAIETVGEKAVTSRELLPDLGPVGKEKLRGDRAFDFLEAWCRQSNIRPPLPLAEAVHLHLGQPPVLASYPVWIMLDVTQRTWPGRISNSPLLGEVEREHLGREGAYLPSLRDKALQREALFRRLIQTGEELTVLSRPEMDEDNRPLSETPFIPRFLREMKGWRQKNLETTPMDILTGEGDYRFPAIDPDPLERERCGPLRVWETSRDESDESGTESSGIAVSDLHELLSCPLLWWLRRRAKLRERSLELTTPVDWGNLAHALWEGVWRRFAQEVQTDPQAPFLPLVEEEWRELREREAYRKFAWFVKDARFQRRMEGLRFRVMRLGEFQDRVISRMRQMGFRYREIRLEDHARLTLTLGGVVFTGRCDRVEVWEGGDGPRAVITDYKSGKCGKYEKVTKLKGCAWNRAEDGGDGRAEFRFGLQLSAYALMFAQQYPNIPLNGVEILSLEEGKAAGTFAPDVLEGYLEKKPRGLPSLEARREEAEYAMTRAAALLRSGEFRPNGDSAFCKSCGMKGICRRGEVRGEVPDTFDEEEEDEE